MSSSITIEVLFLALLIALNGVLAMAEIAVVSARKARLQHMVNEGNARAEVALNLANEPSDFLSTIQVGITLVGIVAGVFGGARIADPLADWLSGYPIFGRFSGAIAIGLVVIVITYLTLILGELAPKRYALHDPERVASTLAIPIQWVAKVTRPLVRFLSFSTNLVLRIAGIRSSALPSVTEEEIKVMISEATGAGVFHSTEQGMVEGVFRLGDRRVGSIITPRTEVVWLDLDDSLQDSREKILASKHTRFPVASENLDHIQGIAHAKDLLGQCLQAEEFNVLESMITPVFVPESMPALRVLEVIKETGHQMILVIDEFGGFQGLVTLDDLMEAVVGDIPAVGERFEQGITRREDGSWLIDGLLPIDEFIDAFGIHGLETEGHGEYQTVGGFVMTTLGRIPTTGDHFDYEGFRFEVVDMDGMRIDKVLVKEAP